MGVLQRAAKRPRHASKGGDGALPAIARVLRYVFLVAPCRLYHRGDESGGSTPWITLGAITGIAVVGYFAGSLTAWLWPSTRVEPIDGTIVAMAAFTVWAFYAILLFGALFLLGRPPADFVGEQWRRRRRRWWDR